MPTPEWKHLKANLMELHRAALAAADPRVAVESALGWDGTSVLRVGDEVLSLPPGGRIVVVAAGKASLGMTAAARGVLGERLAAGVVAHPEDARVPRDWPEALRLFAAGHPLPDTGSLAAGDAVEALAGEVGEEDLVLVLLSGGGSALLELLRPGVTLESVQGVTGSLQRAGADIFELNIVRRSLSRIKGGGLTRMLAPARVVSLALSDVVGDRPEAIASGPTVRSPSGARDALAVLERYGLTDSFESLVNALR